MTEQFSVSSKLGEGQPDKVAIRVIAWVIRRLVTIIHEESA